MLFIVDMMKTSIGYVKSMSLGNYYGVNLQCLLERNEKTLYKHSSFNINQFKKITVIKCK